MHITIKKAGQHVTLEEMSTRIKLSQALRQCTQVASRVPTLNKYVRQIDEYQYTVLVGTSEDQGCGLWVSVLKEAIV